MPAVICQMRSMKTGRCSARRGPPRRSVAAILRLVARHDDGEFVFLEAAKFGARRQASRKCSAMLASSASPPGRPSVSLTSRKSSRSIKREHNQAGTAVRPAHGRDDRACTARLGSPVTRSWLVSMRIISLLRSSDCASRRAARTAKKSAEGEHRADSGKQHHSRFMAPTSAPSLTQLSQPTIRPLPLCSDWIWRSASSNINRSFF